jgi:hypothetical protein
MCSIGSIAVIRSNVSGLQVCVFYCKLSIDF